MNTTPAFHDHDHSGCTAAALSHATQVAQARGLRLTPVRKRALEILLAKHEAVGAYDVLEGLAASGFGSQPPVAYRALDFLVEHGFAHRIRRLNAYTACMHPGTEHSPAFFICEGCDCVAEAPAQDVRASVDQAAGSIGFQVARVNVEVTGLCPACQGHGGAAAE